MLRLVLASLLAFALLGCRVAPPSADPPVPGDDPSPEPKPLVEAEPGATPIVFGYVTPGGERSTGLPQMVDKGGLAWVAGVAAGDEVATKLEFAEGFEDRPDEWWVRELAIADTDLAQVQLAGVWRHHPGPDEEWNPCQESADMIDWTGRFRSSRFEPIATGLEDEPWVSGVELIGAFVVGDEPRWLVFSASMQALIVTPGAESRWLVTGVHHDEVVASAGWSPVSGCEP